MTLTSEAQSKIIPLKKFAEYDVAVKINKKYMHARVQLSMKIITTSYTQKARRNSGRKKYTSKIKI